MVGVSGLRLVEWMWSTPPPTPISNNPDAPRRCSETLALPIFRYRSGVSAPRPSSSITGICLAYHTPSLSSSRVPSTQHAPSSTSIAPSYGPHGPISEPLGSTQRAPRPDIAGPLSKGHGDTSRQAFRASQAPPTPPFRAKTADSPHVTLDSCSRLCFVRAPMSRVFTVRDMWRMCNST